MAEPSQSERQITTVFAVWGIVQHEEWADDVHLINGCVYADKESAEAVAELALTTRWALGQKFDDVNVEEIPISDYRVADHRAAFEAWQREKFGGEIHG